jgi:hypothetical protein
MIDTYYIGWGWQPLNLYIIEVYKLPCPPLVMIDTYYIGWGWQPLNLGQGSLYTSIMYKLRGCHPQPM